jgi:NADH-quinone oxidoreductase subunit F
MGTCGRGNGAEEVYHALNEAIQRSGLDVLLTGVGCLGSCFQEPLVSVRLPGSPLVMLHACAVPTTREAFWRACPLGYCRRSDLLQDRGMGSHYCALEIRPGLSGCGAWNAIPFFKGQKKIVLRNCGLINP